MSTIIQKPIGSTKLNAARADAGLKEMIDSACAVSRGALNLP